MSIELRATTRRGNKLSKKELKYYQSIISTRRDWQWVQKALAELFQINPQGAEMACRALATILQEELAQGNSVHIKHIGTFTNKIRTTAMPTNTNAHSHTPIRYSVNFEPDAEITLSIRRAKKVFTEQDQPAQQDNSK